MTFIVYISRQVNERVIEIGMHVMCNPGHTFRYYGSTQLILFHLYSLTFFVMSTRVQTNNDYNKRREQITNHVVLSRTCSQRRTLENAKRGAS